MKGLGQSNSLSCDVLDSMEIVLSLLGGLKHGLKCLPLMGRI
jgi:hypothetical protein